MLDWNAIVTIKPQHFRAAVELLEPLASVKRTNYHNVLALRVDDAGEFLETLREWIDKFPDTQEAISHVSPVAETFSFNSPETFESQAKEAAALLLDQLAGRSFHVRVHRRGWKGRLATPTEEQLLGEHLHDRLQQAGKPGRTEFEDPDCVVVVEILDNRAGLAVWTREERARYPFLNID